MAKNGPKWQKILSVSLRITGKVYHIIVIFGILELNGDISSICYFLGF